MAHTMSIGDEILLKPGHLITVHLHNVLDAVVALL